jgi:methyltransferase OMS1
MAGRRFAFGAASAAVYGTGVLVAYEATRPKPPLLTCDQRCCKFAELAPRYDGEIARDEESSGILAWRKELAAHAKGKVLEVAGGTARNLPFYPDSVHDLVIGDNCEAMLQVAARNVAELRAADAQHCPTSVTLAVFDAAKMPFASASFDTVVDTFGICSFEDPVGALKEMARCCRPGGSILLLEHGASSLPPLRWWQEHRLNRHVSSWGCYWNRDIEGLVRQSGLRIVMSKSKHLGTTRMLLCEPPK